MGSEPLRVWCVGDDQVSISDRLARLSLNPIVRAHRDDRLDPVARLARYGSLLTDYALVGPAEAEVAVLPRFVEHLTSTEVRSAVTRAEQAGLRTLVFSGDDIEPLLPSASMVLLHPGPTRGAQPAASSLAVPYFFSDRARWPEPRPDGDRPSVAFCGQGAARPSAAVAQFTERVVDAARNRLRPQRVMPPIRGHVGLRSQALRRLTDHPEVDDHFVIRDRYRAGSATEEDRARTQQEFDANLRSATYTLCIRGTGNFSARFYEALSFGRIPIFVDTRCVLPFDDEIDWRTRTLWVDRGEVGAIAERLVASHPSVRADPVRSADALRTLWEDRLTQDGFFRHLVGRVRSLTA